MAKFLRLFIHLGILLLAASLHFGGDGDRVKCAYNNELSFSDDAGIYKVHVQQTNTASYKVQGKRKIKVRYRARHIYFDLTPLTTEGQNDFYVAHRIDHNFEKVFLSSNSLFSFRLRGPPSDILV
jgi:hypothetical protein